MEKKQYLGYMRVSSREQNEDRQRIALMEVGVPEGNIYVDKLSGKDFDRPQYRKLLQKMNENTILFVKSIDRLGRNYTDLNEQWKIITKEKGDDRIAKNKMNAHITTMKATDVNDKVVSKGTDYDAAITYTCKADTTLADETTARKVEEATGAGDILPAGPVVFVTENRLYE